MGGLSTGSSPVVHMGDLTPEDRDGLIGAVARAFADGEGPVFPDLLAARVAVDTVFPLIAAQVWAERVAIVAVLSEFAPLALPHNDLPTIVRGIGLQRDNQHVIKDHLAEVARKLTEERNRLREQRGARSACDTCDDTGAVRMEYDGSPGSGGWFSCPDCQPTPPVPVDEPEAVQL